MKRIDCSIKCNLSQSGIQKLGLKFNPGVVEVRGIVIGDGFVIAGNILTSDGVHLGRHIEFGDGISPVNENELLKLIGGN